MIDIPQVTINNKCDLLPLSKIDIYKTRKEDEIFISAENDDGFDELRSRINNELFQGIYRGWISMDNNLGNIRSKLFDMGCIEEESISDCGKMLANIKIGNDELDQFVNIKGFKLWHDKDILS